MEDVYDSKLMEVLTKCMDSLVNFEFKNHPHTNKTEAEWEIVFQKTGLNVKSKSYFKALGIFGQVVFVLEKK